MKKFILPTLTLTIFAMLYTGCGRKQERYLFMHPVLTLSRQLPSGLSAPVLPGSEINYSELDIRVTIPTKNMNVTGLFNLSGNTAYATTIPAPSPTPIEKITRIQIRPTNYYNSTYQAFADISPICSFYINGDTVSMAEAVTFINEPRDYYSGVNGFTVKLLEQPAVAVEQEFIVELITDNNSRLADTTFLITLTN